MEYDIELLVKYYYKKISTKKFMKYLNSNAALQNDFNKSLKKSWHTDSIVDYMNACFAPTGKYKFTDFKKRKEERKKSEFLIWLHVRDFLVINNYTEYLKKEDVEDIILSEALDSSAFYSAGKDVENYVKSKIMSEMPESDTVKKKIKYVKDEIKNRFTCDEKMPRWLQTCEWPFDSCGEPMIFKNSTGNSERKVYTFYSKNDKSEKVVEQFT